MLAGESLNSLDFMDASAAATRNIPVADVSDKCLPDGKRLLVYRIEFPRFPWTNWPWPGNPTASRVNNVTFPYWVDGGTWALPYQRITLQPGASQIKPLSVIKSVMFQYRHFYNSPDGIETIQDDGTGGINNYTDGHLELCILANNSSGQAVYIGASNTSATQLTPGPVYPNRLVTQGCVPFFATDNDTFDVFKMLNITNWQSGATPSGLLTLQFANFDIAPWWTTVFGYFTP